MLADDHVWVVVLAGGIGSRFWPVSTPERPKQLLPLASDAPLISDTIERYKYVCSAIFAVRFTLHPGYLFVHARP